MIRARAGGLSLSADFVIDDGGGPDEVAPEAAPHSPETLRAEHLVYLLGSRYCETDRIVEIAWSRSGSFPKGWPVVQATCDYVHDRISFGYQHAGATRQRETPMPSGAACAGISITLCRCMTIPTRYCPGHLGRHRRAARPFANGFQRLYTHRLQSDHGGGHVYVLPQLTA